MASRWSPVKSLPVSIMKTASSNISFPAFATQGMLYPSDFKTLVLKSDGYMLLLTGYNYLQTAHSNVLGLATIPWVALILLMVHGRNKEVNRFHLVNLSMSFLMFIFLGTTKL